MHGDTGTNLTWTLDANEDWLGSAATYTESGRAGILVSGRTGMAILGYENGTVKPWAVVKGEARLDTWVLNMSGDNLGHGV